MPSEVKSEVSSGNISPGRNMDTFMCWLQMGQVSAGFMIVCVLLSTPYDERKIEKAFTCVILRTITFAVSRCESRKIDRRGSLHQIDQFYQQFKGALMGITV